MPDLTKGQEPQEDLRKQYITYRTIKDLFSKGHQEVVEVDEYLQRSITSFTSRDGWYVLWIGNEIYRYPQNNIIKIEIY